MNPEIAAIVDKLPEPDRQKMREHLESVTELAERGALIGMIMQNLSHNVGQHVAGQTARTALATVTDRSPR